MAVQRGTRSALRKEHLKARQTGSRWAMNWVLQTVDLSALKKVRRLVDQWGFELDNLWDSKLVLHLVVMMVLHLESSRAVQKVLQSVT